MMPRRVQPVRPVHIRNVVIEALYMPGQQALNDEDRGEDDHDRA